MYEYSEEWNAIYKNSTLIARVNDDMEAKELAINIIESANKSVPLKAKKGNYDGVFSDGYSLCCPVCNEIIGSLDNEDNDGVYKYNIVHKYCPECGQKIEQNYTEDDYKTWGV